MEDKNLKLLFEPQNQFIQFKTISQTLNKTSYQILELKVFGPNF